MSQKQEEVEEKTVSEAGSVQPPTPLYLLHAGEKLSAFGNPRPDGRSHGGQPLQPAVQLQVYAQARACVRMIKISLGIKRYKSKVTL